MELTPRQIEIIQLVHKHAPITGEQIAEMLGVSRPTIRSDLSVLVMLGSLDAKPKVGYFPGSSETPGTGIRKKMEEMKVRDMQSVPVVIAESATVQDAVVMLFTENVGRLDVIDGEGGLAGIVSSKDLLKLTLGNVSAGSMPVSLVMTRKANIVTASPDDSVLESSKKMIRHDVDGLPVVAPAAGADGADGKPQVIGRISKSSILRLVVELALGP